MPDVRTVEKRLAMLEILAEERLRDVESLQRFVAGYEERIRTLEREVARLAEGARVVPDDMPALQDDLPPHY